MSEKTLPCLDCQEPLPQVPGHKARRYCNSTCRSNYWAKNKRKQIKFQKRFSDVINVIEPKVKPQKPKPEIIIPAPKEKVDIIKSLNPLVEKEPTETPVYEPTIKADPHETRIREILFQIKYGPFSKRKALKEELEQLQLKRL